MHLFNGDAGVILHFEKKTTPEENHSRSIQTEPDTL
jgi:hypothetical protein